MRRSALLLLAALLAACAPPPPRTGGAKPLPPGDAAQPGPAQGRQPAVAGDPPAAAAAQVAASECGEDKRILVCLRPAFDATSPITLSLATSPTGIALAWVAPMRHGGRAAYVGVLRPDLTVVDGYLIPSLGEARDAAIAPMPGGGWLLVTVTPQGLEVRPLDPRGAIRHVDPRRIPGGYAPLLAARPDGAPLLVWSGGPGTQAALLDEEGGERWRAHVFQSSIGPRLGSAVHTGDGFLVAGRPRGVAIVRLELDGRMGPALAQVGERTEYPQLAWNGGSASVTFSEFSGDGRMQWAKLDRTGALAGAPITLGSVPEYFNPAPALGLGQDTVVLLGGYTGTTATATHLELTRLDPAGAPVVAPWPVLPRGAERATDYRLALQGRELVAAWLEGAYQPGKPAQRIGVARLAP